MAVDYWPQEEGYIVEGAPVMMCKSAGTITEMANVKISATAVGCVTVDHSAVWGDCIGVALRASTTAGQMIPVAFEGIVKVLTDATLALGQTVCNQAGESNKVIDTPASANLMQGDDGGTAYVLGTLMQAATTEGDEVLMMLGRK